MVQTTGEVLDSARDYVRRQVAAFIRRLPWPLVSARVKLTVFSRASGPWAALAQVNLELRDHPVRAQVPVAFLHEAGRLLRLRLAAQVARLTHPDMPRPWPSETCRGVQPVSHAARRRAIVRRKSYPLSRCTPDQAALTMDVMDYDFHLFTDADTGQDSLIYRVGPTGYRLARLSGMAPPSAPVTVPLTINVHPVPEATLEQAVARLTATEMPYQFFRDHATGRGAVLYRRYDGNYGLLAPAPPDQERPDAEAIHDGQ
ncbi:sigma 54 modulation/S30EA ribosomal C-terminal domain-containing protein [Kibdelosporangium philippinense]|uniref:Sigma 54 modulation/S30EA ribosomal C-terminal domain-containing protein n=1 Tax=Kibdelosporangium philippinense TaxID=211113 RepID=A0ABS8ZJ68_9PSEU|nr:sigma 54 modulation/S30EA ribosomal C-terminal domain-containing protein [Kibdelosporangium philippinense]MCE7007000.1 sigma 54 modulation/S30EA ribosomal C-terminal domain-containing protein [Kibdelosporangium philippinense]